MPNTFDATMKDLVTKHPDDWARFVGLSTRTPTEVIPADLSVVSAAADSLLRCGETVLHLEFQAGPDAELPERVLLYNVLARRQTRLPVHTVVLLLQPNTGRVPDQVEYTADPTRGGLTFRFEVIAAWDRPADEFLSGPFALMPLAMIAQPPPGLTRAAMLPEVIRRIDARARAESPGDLQHITLAAFLLGGLRFDEDRLTEIFLGLTGMEGNAAIRVIEKFGELKAVRRILSALATERFGPPTPDQQEKLNRIDKLDRLDRLAVRVLKVDSWDALLRGR